jgi:hypothetical protein
MARPPQHRRLLPHGMSMAAVGATVVAAFELRAVQLLRDAIRTTEAASSDASPLAPVPTSEARRRFQPQPVFEPPVHRHPEPVFGPRPILHDCHPLRAIGPDCCLAPVEVKCEGAGCSPLQPPWKVLPWETPIPPQPKVKVVLYRPDVIHKGSLIDFFM